MQNCSNAAPNEHTNWLQKCKNMYATCILYIPTELPFCTPPLVVGRELFDMMPLEAALDAAQKGKEINPILPQIILSSPSSGLKGHTTYPTGGCHRTFTQIVPSHSPSLHFPLLLFWCRISLRERGGQIERKGFYSIRDGGVQSRVGHARIFFFPEERLCFKRFFYKYPKKPTNTCVCVKPIFSYTTVI